MDHSSRRSLAFACAALCLVPPILMAQAAPEKPTVTLSGVIYAQYLYGLRDPDGSGHENNFDVTRAYVNVLGKFTGGVASRVTGDVYRNADGSLSYRLKYGYVAWQPQGSALTYKFGLWETPYVAYAEGLWDYRMQGTDPTDRAGYLSSADFGAGVEGAWARNGVILSAGVFNGEFYSKKPGDQHKDAEARVSVRLLESDDPSVYGGLRLTGFGLVGQPNGGGRRDRFLGQLSYRSKAVTLAGTFVATGDRLDQDPTSPPTTHGRLVSVMGVYRIPTTKLAVIGRFDSHDPDTDTPDDGLSRVIGGISYQLSPNLRVLGDLDHTWYQTPPAVAVDRLRSQALFQLQVVF